MIEETEREPEENDADDEVERDEYGYALCAGRRTGAYGAGIQCNTRGSIERNGKWYCMQHTPEMVALVAKLKAETRSPSTAAALSMQRVRAAALLGVAAAARAGGAADQATEFFRRADAMAEGMNMRSIDDWIRNEIRRYIDAITEKPE